MYEEKSGVNDAVVEETLVQAADEQGDDVVTIADIMGDEPAETADAQDEQGEQQEDERLMQAVLSCAELDAEKEETSEAREQ